MAAENMADEVPKPDGQNSNGKSVLVTLLMVAIAAWAVYAGHVPFPWAKIRKTLKDKLNI